MPQYNIPEIPYVQFTQFWSFVEAAYRDSLRGKPYVKPMELLQATSELDEIPSFLKNKSTRADGKYVGYAWHGQGRMWVKPGREHFDIRRTAIHELAHLRVEGESHGPKFRRVFGVALAVYMRSIGRSETQIRFEIREIISRYRHHRTWTPQGRYNSWSMHQDKVYAELESIYKASLRVSRAL